MIENIVTEILYKELTRNVILTQFVYKLFSINIFKCILSHQSIYLFNNNTFFKLHLIYLSFRTQVLKLCIELII